MKRHSAQRLMWGVALVAVMAIGSPSYGAGPAEMLKGVDVTGFVEASYLYNFNAPINNFNSYRVFDTTANSFTMNNAQLSFVKAPKTGAGFGLVLGTGSDANVTSSSGDNFDVWQAYISDTTMDGNLNLKFGKFATLAGAEVKEGIANYNISRSILFGFAIPFVHTGVRATFSGPQGMTIVGGINNGWGTGESDNNAGKTAELQVGLAPSDMLSFTVLGMYGPEPANFGNDNRGLVDLVATFKPAKNLAFVLNYDRTSQSQGSGNGTDLGQGYALYANVGIDDNSSVTLRWESFDDANGFFTGANGVGGGNSLQEATLTLSHKHSGIEWRAELRHDMSNQDVFGDDTGVATKDTQNTFAVAAYYPF